MLNDGEDLSSLAAELAELCAALGRPFDGQGWSILAEAHLRDPATTGDAAGLPGPSASPVPAVLAARADELSARFARRLTASESLGEAKLTDQLTGLSGMDRSCRFGRGGCGGKVGDES